MKTSVVLCLAVSLTPVISNAQQGSPASPTATSSRYPMTVERTWDASQLSKKSADGWCAKWTKRIRDDNAAAKNEIVSMSACECKRDSAAPANTVGFLERDYSCKFGYVVKLNRPGNAR